MKVKAYAKYKFRIFRRFFFPKRIKNYGLIKTLLRDKSGIEIGGPSKIFNDIIKIYPLVRSVDGVNFSTDTVWEGKIKDNSPYYYGDIKLGTQHINDATDLNSVISCKYDFLISSHCLEHVANPLKALKEWNRVVKHGGEIILVLPNPEFTFDCTRKRTTFDHILDDYRNDIGEDDETHVQDAIENSDLSKMYVLNGTAKTMEYEDHVAYCRDNPRLRRVHHHCFTDEVVHQMLETSGFKLITTEHFQPFHMIYVARKD